MLVDAQSDHITFQFIGAWDHLGEVIDSYTIYAQPAANRPDVASGLTATAVSSVQVNLAWKDNSSNEDGFVVEQSVNGGSFTQIATVGANVMSYAVTGLSASTSYSFRVEPFNAADPLEQFRNDFGTIAMQRSAAAPGTGQTNARQQINTESNYIDTASVYSSSPTRLDWLRGRGCSELILR